MSLISNLFINPVPKHSNISVDSRCVVFTTTDAPGNDACLLIMSRIVWIRTHQRTTPITLENKSIQLPSVHLKLKRIRTAELSTSWHSDKWLTETEHIVTFRQVAYWSWAHRDIPTSDLLIDDKKFSVFHLILSAINGIICQWNGTCCYDHELFFVTHST